MITYALLQTCSRGSYRSCFFILFFAWKIMCLPYKKSENSPMAYPLFLQQPRRDRCPLGHRGNLYVPPAIHLFFSLSFLHNPPAPDSASQQWRALDGWTERRLGWRTDFPLHSAGHCPLWGRCPASFKTAIATLVDRAREVLTINCLWAIGFLIMPFYFFSKDELLSFGSLPLSSLSPAALPLPLFKNALSAD